MSTTLVPDPSLSGNQISTSPAVTPATDASPPLVSRAIGLSVPAVPPCGKVHTISVLVDVVGVQTRMSTFSDKIPAVPTGKDRPTSVTLPPSVYTEDADVMTGLLSQMTSKPS